MDRPALYLHIPEEYCRSLGGLRWCADGEAVEFGDGRTFAFAPEVTVFVEGFAGQRPLVHFGHILHLMCLLNDTHCMGKQHAPAVRRLGDAFRSAGKMYRNAGAFFGALCGDIPAVAEPPTAFDVWQSVNLRPFSLVLYVAASRPHAVESPALLPEVFEARVLRALAGYTDDALRHWFRNGRGPVGDAGAAVADVLKTKPRSLDGVLADVVRRQRLAGASPFVAQLTGALTLPPRRLAQPHLQLGGYADVTNRGGPEAILPSQFALDDLEFVRRCAERELLYFRREEPHDRTREELVVLVDQGVRTWGTVRLVLSAAVLALGRLAGTRKLPFRVAATSAGGVVEDPLQMADDTFAALLEASDLSPDPGLALERVLEKDADAPRDVVLLTHPRNLGEPDVQAAARRLRPRTRLFAVAVDDRGDVEFSRVQHGVPVRLTRFHVDLNPTAPPAPVRNVEEPRRAWRGDVEPIGFPFAFGAGGGEHARAPFHFDFDHAGDWLATASTHGVIHATRTDGSRTEILPRGMVGDDRVVREILHLVGVASGFVAVGALPDQLAAVHYDFRTRKVKVHVFPKPAGNSQPVSRYSRKEHALLLIYDGAIHSVRLATGERQTLPITGALATMQLHLPGRWMGYLRTPFQENGETTDPHALLCRPSLMLDPQSGLLSLHNVVPEWTPFAPAAEGRLLLRDCQPEDADCQGHTLAARFKGPESATQKSAEVLLFRGPDGVPLGVYKLRGDLRFKLSSDGRLLARQTDARQLEVIDVQGGPAKCVTPTGRQHNNLHIVLGERWLLLGTNKVYHLVRWDQGRLTFAICVGDTEVFLRRELAATKLEVRGVEARPGRLPEFVAYDKGRFVRAAWGNLIAVVDAFGHVGLFEANGDLVCMIFAFRETIAAWSPEGSRMGNPGLLGGPATPDAAIRIGRALLAAWERGEGRTT